MQGRGGQRTQALELLAEGGIIEYWALALRGGVGARKQVFVAALAIVTAEGA